MIARRAMTGLAILQSAVAEGGVLPGAGVMAG